MKQLLHKVLNKTDYLAEAERQLSDRSTYQPLSHDPTSTFNTDLSKFLTTAGPSQGLSKDDLSLLHNPKPRTPSLYFLPKVHKPNNPGRPIVASFSSSTERVSAYIDAHLQPIVKSLPSYIKDSNHFLQIILSLPMPLTPLPPSQDSQTFIIVHILPEISAEIQVTFIFLHSKTIITKINQLT